MFRNRTDAAQRLAEKLLDYKDARNAVILAIPRGGVAIGGLLSRELHLPLDILLSKKIGHPYNSEFAIGAVTLTGEEVDEALLESEGIPREYVRVEVQRIHRALWQKYKMYRGDERPLSLGGKTVILTDDGVATGHSLLAAIASIRREDPARIVVAVPVASPSAWDHLSPSADEVVCLATPEDFAAIGEFYDDFSPVEDIEAARILTESRDRLGHKSSARA